MRKHRSDAAYNRPPDDWLIEEYLKAVPDLMIYKQNEAKLLHNELLETKVAQQNKDSEMKELKEQIEEIRYLYQSLLQRNTTARNLTSVVNNKPKRVCARDIERELVASSPARLWNRKLHYRRI